MNSKNSTLWILNALNVFNSSPPFHDRLLEELARMSESNFDIQSPCKYGCFFFLIKVSKVILSNSYVSPKSVYLIPIIKCFNWSERADGFSVIKLCWNRLSQNKKEITCKLPWVCVCCKQNTYDLFCRCFKKVTLKVQLSHLIQLFKMYCSRNFFRLKQYLFLYYDCSWCYSIKNIFLYIY